MSIHVAILLRRYIDLILSGVKTVESRLTINRLAPFGQLKPGERIFFKRSAGPFMATALARTVHEYADLTPARLRQLQNRFNKTVCGDPAYWRFKRRSRYATFIELEQVQPLQVGPSLAKSQGLAWFVLPEALNPIIESSITRGALNNRYLRLPPCEAGPIANGEIHLHLPDGQHIVTRLLPNQLIRWRGWGRYYEQHRMTVGDVVQLIRTSPSRYDVRFCPRNTLDHAAT